MTWRRAAAVMVAACAAAAVIDARQAAQQPIFRSTADVVTVDVSVRTGGTPVGGLTAKDFVLLDNGVPQTIESIEMAAVPLDVSILIDANEDVAPSVRSMTAQVPRIAALLRADDRVRVTSISGYVADVVRARPTALGLERPSALKAEGFSSAYDGLAAALLRPVDRSRRHVIVAITNGIDAVSTLDPAAVAEIARRSDALLHIVQVDVGLEGPPGRMYWKSGRKRHPELQCYALERCWPARATWRAYDDERFHPLGLGEVFQTLRQAAESTGGALHHPGIFTTASSIFRKVIEDYRRSYLLRYTPQGVTREGWHEITVTVPARPAYAVHARRGYSIEAPGNGGVPERVTKVPKPDLSRVPSARGAIVEAYNRADYERLESELRRAINLATLIEDFRKAGNPWPARPRREAAMVIELAEAGLHSRGAAARTAAGDLLRDYRKLVRHPLGPDEFDRMWLWAVLSIVQGVNQQTLARDFVDYALMRYPEEPRFVLARAFVTDQSRAFDASNSRTGAAQPAHVREVTARYDAAMRFGETAAEAGVRKAFFLHRIGRHAEALAALDAVDAGAADRDPMVGYLRRLFRGRVLEALERFDEARGAYQAALDLQPAAQSPKVALMRLLVRAGDRNGADALAAGIQAAPADSFDPWWVYWLGDYRAYPNVIDSLREQTR